MGRESIIKHMSLRGPSMGQIWQMKKIPSAFAATGIESVNMRHHGDKQEMKVEEEGQGKVPGPSAARQFRRDKMRERKRRTRGKPERKEE